LIDIRRIKMNSCWLIDPSLRPKFPQLIQHFEQKYSKMKHQPELNNENLAGNTEKFSLTQQCELGYIELVTLSQPVELGGYR